MIWGILTVALLLGAAVCLACLFTVLRESRRRPRHRA